MSKELIRTPSPTPERIEKTISSLELNMEAVARMDPAMWEKALSEFKAQIQSTPNLKDLRIIEGALNIFLRDQALLRDTPPLSAKTFRRFVGATTTGIGATGTAFFGNASSSGLLTALAIGFSALTIRDIRAQFKMHQFRLSEEGAERMSQLAKVLHQVRGRVEEQIPSQIIDGSVESP